MGASPSHSTLSTFTSLDGDNLAVQAWPLPEGVARRGVVLLVHGLGEHAGRYDTLAQRLNDWGFEVRGYDQCGHGESDGPRGAIPTTSRLIDDLDDMVASTRRRMPPDMPLILFGHSLGALVAACQVALGGEPVDALVLSSPALDAGLRRWQRLLLRALPRAALALRVRNRLDVDALSHDPQVARAYRADPLVHDRVSLRLVRFIARAGPWVIARAPRWKVPTLLLYAGDDRLVDPAGSRAFAAAAPQAVVTAQCFQGLYHEIFNEADSEPVVGAFRQWLDARF